MPPGDADPIATCATCDTRMIRLPDGIWRCPVDQRHGDRMWPDEPDGGAVTRESLQLEIDHLQATHYRAACPLCRDLPCTAEDRQAVDQRDQRLADLAFRRDAWLFERS